MDSAYPTTAYWKDSGATDSYQHVGHISAGQSDDGNAHTTRSYWQLDTSALNSKYIKSASFNTTETYSFSCTAREVDLYYAHSVTPSSTWHDQPGLITKLDSHNVVAHGYNSNCGPAAVGFDATAGVQAAAAGNADTVTLALVAKDEADEYGWKKFDSVASMIVTYENYPQVPAGRAVTPCWAQCAEPTITRLQNPGVQAVSFINESNPPSLLYRYQVCSGWSSTAPGACQPFFTDTKAFGVTSAVAVPQQLASVGNYEYRAQACRADDTLVCSGWSGFYEFTVDALPPPTPAVASSDFDLTGQSRKGQELVQGSIQVSPNGSVDDYAYSYSPTAGSAAISSPDCPATYGDVIVSCAGAGGAPVSYSVLPTVPSSNRVVVYAYDKAGNVSASASYRYDVIAKLAGDASHAWFDHSAPVPGGSTPDAVGATTPISLGPVDGTHVRWSTATSAPAPPFSTDSYGALSFDGSGALSTSSSSIPVATLDPTHSFTLAVWLLPANPNLGQYAAVSQESGNSAFFMQEKDSKWQFCLPRNLISAWGSDCATSTSNVDATDWSLLIGQWDAPNHTIRLYVSDQSTVTTSDHPYIATATSGSLVLGRMQYGGVQKNWWTGGIADPITYPFLLDAGQIDALSHVNLANCLSQGNCS
ncbi:MAG: LamG-like jellyroll fold domain-containing protein [Jatrophihabitantaceae bacterium]